MLHGNRVAPESNQMSFENPDIFVCNLALPLSVQTAQLRLIATPEVPDFVVNIIMLFDSAFYGGISTRLWNGKNMHY